MRKQGKGDEKVCGDLKHLRRRRWTVAWRSPPDWHAKKNKKCRKMQKMQQQENCKLENLQILTKAQLDEHERITSRFTKKWLWANIMIFHFISKRPFRWCTLTIAFIVVVWYWRPNGSTGLRSRLQGGLYRRSSYSPTPPGGGATGALMWHKTSPFLSLLSSFCLFRARRNLRPFFCWKNTPSKHSFTKTTNLLDKETL